MDASITSPPISHNAGVKNSETFLKSKVFVISYFWHNESNETCGHSVICISAKALPDQKYSLTLCDPNYHYKVTRTLTFSNNTISFAGHTISSFEYYTPTALQSIFYIDIDGQYNTLTP